MMVSSIALLPDVLQIFTLEACWKFVHLHESDQKHKNVALTTLVMWTSFKVETFLRLVKGKLSGMKYGRKSRCGLASHHHASTSPYSKIFLPTKIRSNLLGILLKLVYYFNYVFSWRFTNYNMVDILILNSRGPARHGMRKSSVPSLRERMCT